MIERGVTAKARRSSTEALTTRSRKPPQNDGFAYHGRPSSACRLKSSSPHADESVASIIDAMPISQSGRSGEQPHEVRRQVVGGNARDAWRFRSSARRRVRVPWHLGDLRGSGDVAFACHGSRRLVKHSRTPNEWLVAR